MNIYSWSKLTEEVRDVTEPFVADWNVSRFQIKRTSAGVKNLQLVTSKTVFASAAAPSALTQVERKNLFDLMPDYSSREQIGNTDLRQVSSRALIQCGNEVDEKTPSATREKNRGNERLSTRFIMAPAHGRSLTPSPTRYRWNRAGRYTNTFQRPFRVIDFVIFIYRRIGYHLFPRRRESDAASWNGWLRRPSLINRGS